MAAKTGQALTEGLRSAFREPFSSHLLRASLLHVDLTDYLRASRKTLIFTGAGISTASGIPDFRGPQGVWKRRQPVYYDEFMSSEAARLEHWDYKLEGWESFRDARPNAVHEAIVKLERAGRLQMLITQNIDGLHALAGTSAERLVEIHGTNTKVECQSCHERDDPKPHFEFFRKHRTPPLCRCGGYLKPATISFGQSLDSRELDRAQRAALARGFGDFVGLHAFRAPGRLVSIARRPPRRALRRHQSRRNGSRWRSMRHPQTRGRGHRHFPASYRRCTFVERRGRGLLKSPAQARDKTSGSGIFSSGLPLRSFLHLQSLQLRRFGFCSNRTRGAARGESLLG